MPNNPTVKIATADNAARFSFVGPASLSIPAEIDGGSHSALRVGNDKVVVRNVELFAEMDDGPLGAIDRSKLDSIVATTNDKFAQGRFPRIKLTHDDGAPIVGRISSPLYVARNNKNGKLTIYGDMELTGAAFAQYVASNAYPSRSAEITPKEMWMFAVALLGDDMPRADLPDVVFSDEGGTHTAKACFSHTPKTNFPNFKEIRMSFAEYMAKCSEEIERESDKSKKAEMGKSLANLAKKYAMEDGDADDAAKNALATAELAKFRMELDTVTAGLKQRDETIAKLSNTLIDQTYRGELLNLKNVAGYSTINVEDELKVIFSMPTDELRRGYVEKIKANYRREATGPALMQTPSFAQFAVPGNDAKPIHERIAITEAEQSAQASIRVKVQKFAMERGIANFADAQKQWLAENAR